MTGKYIFRAAVGVGADSSGLFDPTPNAGATFVQTGLYGAVKFARCVCVCGLDEEARNGQTLGVVSAGMRIQF